MYSKARLTLTVMKVWSPKERLIEGRGTKPHVNVAWSRSDIVEGRDPDLAAALREARR
jgi:C-terminal processing protease CtpA/Prc